MPGKLVNKVKPEVGQKYNHLRIIRLYQEHNGTCNITMAECKCEYEKKEGQLCGNIVNKRLTYIIRPDTKIKSCGCLKNHKTSIRLKERNYKHGESDTPLHITWQGMRSRCNNPHPDYGGRGIKICREWEHYAVFAKWARENGYKKDLTIERKDVNGDYCPENCKWIPLEQQQLNTRRSHWVEIDGERKVIAEWARDPRCVVSLDIFWNRIKNLKWEPQKALTTPKKKNKHF